jgi:hypothetical protein
MENLGSLLHLRHLSLKNIPYGCELPKEMGNLRLLQTLDFEHVGSIELPASIIRLTQLKCLSFVDEGIKRVPDGIGKLTSLEQLKIYFGCGSNDYQNNVRMLVKELGSLGELRVLEIKFLFLNDSTVQRCLAESLRNLHKIQHTKLLTSVLRRCRIWPWGKQQALCSLNTLSVICPCNYSSSLGCRHGSIVFTTSLSCHCVLSLWMSRISKLLGSLRETPLSQPGWHGGHGNCE